MKKLLIRAVALAVAAAVLMGLSGCFSAAIREDDIREELPVIDPEDGVARSIDVKCYYRLAGEDCLVGMVRQVDVRAGERAEISIIRELLSGAQEESGVETLFGESIEVIAAELSEGVLNLTLSSSFLSELAYDTAEYEARAALGAGEITKEECDARIAEAMDDMLTKRRLLVYSIVNTITGYSEGVSVQVNVERGTAVQRLTLGDIGLNSDYASQVEATGKLTFDAEYVANGALVMEYFLAHIQKGEYEPAYMLIANNGADGSERPTYAGFEKDVRAPGALMEYTISDAQDAIHAQLVFTGGNCAFDVIMTEENGIPKVSYASFKEGLVSVG